METKALGEAYGVSTSLIELRNLVTVRCVLQPPGASGLGSRASVHLVLLCIRVLAGPGSMHRRKVSAVVSVPRGFSVAPCSLCMGRMAATQLSARGSDMLFR